MDIELNNEVEKGTISNDSAISEFTKELSKTLEIEDLFSYRRPIDNGEFTDENLMKLEEEYKKIVNEFLDIQEFRDSKIYEVLDFGKNYDLIREYDKETEEIINLQVPKGTLPQNYKIGMLLHKENDEFLIDKEMTQEMYYKMKEYETKLLNEQEKYLKKMRKDGELYYVKKIERRLQILENRTKL